MKRFILFLISLVTICLLSAQITTQNYIRTRRMLNNTETNYMDNITYYDGLGRPFQSIFKSVQSGTTKERLATLFEYDTAGRQTSDWLPTPVTADYIPIATLQSIAIGNGGYNDSHPYALSVYDESPLNRPIQQYGAGMTWYDNNRSVKTEYLSNNTNHPLNCIQYSVTEQDTLQNEGVYAANMLNVLKTTDEDNHVTYTFTDKQERTILERRINGNETLDTYYVYDDSNNLRFVLQPMYQKSPDLDKFSFQYKYDGHGNCIWKKLPGTEYMLYEYDNNERLIFSQNGNQRSNSIWTFYVYDSMGRLTSQGENSSKTISSTNISIQHYYDRYTYFRSVLASLSSNYPEGTLGKYPIKYNI